MAARTKGTASTTIEHKDGPRADYVNVGTENEVVDPPVVAVPTSAEKEKPMGLAGHSEGVTINMGSFQSYRIDSWVELPCPPAKLKEVSEWCERFVEKRLQAACDRLAEKAQGKLR